MEKGMKYERHQDETGLAKQINQDLMDGKVISLLFHHQIG